MQYNRKNQRKNQGSRNKHVSNIDPSKLIKKASKSELTPFISHLSFNDFRLSGKLESAIEGKGYQRPTEIQEKSIPSLLEGRDLIGIAATGTGKTGAFLIPIIHQMLHNKNTQALVVVPTRELAMQVQDEFRSLTKGMDLLSSCFIGGTNVNQDVTRARRQNRMIIATPGRLIDLINRSALNLGRCTTLVLDEFDRMLDMGFIRDVRRISAMASNRKQTMLFSATVNSAQEKLIKEFVTSPTRVNVTRGTSSSDNVNQDIISVSSTENKFEVLINMLKDASFEKVILFAETKHGADKISRRLIKSGLKSDVIHGNKSQNYRTRAIQHFKSGKTKILVATDVASRGIDIDNVTHVVNYQLPKTMESYIHRIGRTGRAGKLGMAYTFVN